MTRLRRAWLPGLAVALAVLWLVNVWTSAEMTGQQRVMRTGVTLAVTALVLLVWAMLLSGLPGRARLGLVAVLVALAGLFPAVFRLRGVSGDLVPVLAFRWERPATLPLPPPATGPPGPVAVAATPVAPAVPDVPTGAPLASVAPAALPAAPPAPPPSAGDFPQFLGAGRDGVLPHVELARDWSARPPRLRWRHAVGPAWSGFVVAGGLAVTQEQRGDQELVVAYDRATGAPVWSHADAARYAMVISGEGPRATPTLHEGRAYTLGATGILNALDLKTGRKLWSRDVMADNGARPPEWGKSSSPLVAGDLVIVSAGGRPGRSLVAYHRETGQKAWAGGDDQSGYSSPLMATLAGRAQVLIFNQGSVAGHDPATGAVLWQHPFPDRQPNVSQPLPLPGDRVLVSSGYGVGSKLLQVAAADDGALTARLLWESPRLKAKFTNLLHHQGFIYGLDDGVLTCLDPASGERRWKEGRYGHGQVLLAGGLLLVQTEEGDVVLVDPRPDGLRELTRFSALPGKLWNPPALAGTDLLIRNDQEAVLYELPGVTR